MFPIVELNPFNEGSQWYYILQRVTQVGDAHNVSIATLPSPLSFTICLFFATRTVLFTRPVGNIMHIISTETKEFTMDINSFTNQFSADEAINSMFMNTMTGSAFSPERRLWMATTLSEHIRHFFYGYGSINNTLYGNIIFKLDVEDHIHISSQEEVEDIQDLLEESFEDHEEEEFYEDVEYLSIFPAPPPALVESLKTEVYQSEDGEAKDCMICLEELVARVEVKRLPCSHCFHVGCIDGWLRRKDTCPLCRTKLQADQS